jgi:hypothetical protein
MLERCLLGVPFDWPRSGSLRVFLKEPTISFLLTSDSAGPLTGRPPFHDLLAHCAGKASGVAVKLAMIWVAVRAAL